MTAHTAPPPKRCMQCGLRAYLHVEVIQVLQAHILALRVQVAVERILRLALFAGEAFLTPPLFDVSDISLQRAVHGRSVSLVLPHLFCLVAPVRKLDTVRVISLPNVDVRVHKGVVRLFRPTIRIDKVHWQGLTDFPLAQLDLTWRGRGR